MATGSSVTQGTDSPCAASSANACLGSTELGTGPKSCHHAGEVRAFALPFANCSGVTISDALGAFDWICDASAGVRAISTALKPGKHLSDLIDFAVSPPTWRENSVMAQQGATPHVTAPGKWWDNPIVVDNDGGTLGAAGTIHAVTQNATGLYAIAANNVTLVSAPGVRLLGTGAGQNVVSFGARHFVWLELDIDATGDNRGIASDGSFLVVDNTRVENAGDVGAYLAGAHGVRIRDLTVIDNDDHGLQLSGSCGRVENVVAERNRAGIWTTTQHVAFENLRATDNTDAGVAVNTGGTTQGFNLVEGVVATGNTTDGFSLSGTRNAAFDVYGASNRHNLVVSNQRNLVSGFASFNSRGHGVNLASGTNNVLLAGVVSNSGNPSGSGVHGAGGDVLIAITSLNSEHRGFDGSGESTAMNVAAINSGGQGIYTLSANHAAFIDVAATDSTGPDVAMSGAYGITFSGVMRITNNTKCSVTVVGGGSAGITNTCAMTGGSDALVTFASVAGALAPLVTSDTANGSDVGGIAPFNSITSADFSAFDAFERGWGVQPVAGPLANSQGACIAGGTCRIWDLRAAASDSGGLLRNAVPAPTSGNQAHSHRWLATTSSVCGAIVGATWDAASSACTSTILRGAMELLRDGLGNENGLCESNETCVVLRNIGGYQGHGALVPAGSIGSGGMVTNVTLLAYAQNGV